MLLALHITAKRLALLPRMLESHSSPAFRSWKEAPFSSTIVRQRHFRVPPATDSEKQGAPRLKARSSMLAFCRLAVRAGLFVILGLTSFVGSASAQTFRSGEIRSTLTAQISLTIPRRAWLEPESRERHESPSFEQTKGGTQGILFRLKSNMKPSLLRYAWHYTDGSHQPVEPELAMKQTNERQTSLLVFPVSPATTADELAAASEPLTLTISSE